MLLGFSFLAAPAPMAPFPVAAAEAELAQLERQDLTLVNDERTARRYRAETRGQAAPLRWNAAAAEVARQHSEQMARAGRLTHTGTDGSNVGQRLARAGVAWTRAGENVAMASTVEQAEALMMHEPPFQHNHRGNILDPGFTEVGIGVARAPNGLVYVTQDFLTPAGH
ncbi:MAG: CAP domain-containing protein [Terriglobales bacterium]